METMHLKVEKTARYTTFGNPSTAKYFWVALHGYGQLVKYFVRNFNHLDPVEHFIVCPEGLNKFYLNGLSGRVGATWMTKEGRLEDIADYVAYLDQVYANLINPHLKPNSKKVLFGFSQGVATASRWVAFGNSAFDSAIFWAGSFPPDLPPIKTQASFEYIDTICCTGTQDEFLTPNRISEVKSQLKSLNISAQWHSYEGGHTIPSIELSKISSLLTR